MITRPSARRIRIQGVVQGVGFRPYVYRSAREHQLTGWVANDGRGVEIHVEGAGPALDAFVGGLAAGAPPAARIQAIDVTETPCEAWEAFEIRESHVAERPTTRISPDLPVCDACRRELFDPADRRRSYPYINCTDCGPRYSIIRSLPYDRPRTTMADWTMCEACAREYRDPADRRFHAQPVACPQCGPHYALMTDGAADAQAGRDAGAIAGAARLLREGRIVAIKGVGGYHLACDAADAAAVETLRERKFRKEQAFAVMVRDLAAARATCALTPEAEALLLSPASPIVLAPRRLDLPGVAPDNADLGVMLPYAPVHHLLFAHGAPDRIVLTSGNRSSEPIAFDDADAFSRLHGLADAFLAGERPIARRVDDSVMRAGALGPVVLRRSRGLAPAVVATLPVRSPVLALGGDLKNTLTLVVAGQACTSQHVGDLRHYDARVAFRQTADDLMAMYGVDWNEVLVVHDAHPQYVSTAAAAELPASRRLAVQHHRAHVASVLAERAAIDRRVVGVVLDGTGFGDDGTIWGGELFVGSIVGGFERVAHLRPARLPGGDAAAQHPVQAAAGFLEAVPDLPDFAGPPFHFPERYRRARQLSLRAIRSFGTTSAGRLFDTVAAVAGFVRPIAFEGQAAMWLEHLARQESSAVSYPMTFDGGQIDWRPALEAAVADRLAGRSPARIARAFHRGLARGLASAITSLLEQFGLDTAAVSGGVAQNDLLLADLREALAPSGAELWINHAVPANDGGLSLGQAALAVTAADAA